MNIPRVNTCFFLLAALLAGIPNFHLNAQGFIRQYPSNWAENNPQSVFPQANGGYRMTALAGPDFGIALEIRCLEVDAKGHLLQTTTHMASFTGNTAQTDNIWILEDGSSVLAFEDGNQMRVQRWSPDSLLQWEHIQPFPPYEYVRPLVLGVNESGEVFVRGMLFNSAPNQDYKAFLVKLDASGNLLWELLHEFTVTYVIPISLLPTADGGCILNNWSFTPSLPDSTQGEHLRRYDADGNLLWAYTPYPGRLWPHFSGRVFDVDAQDRTWAFTQWNGDAPNSDFTSIDRLDASGNLIDRLNLDNMLDLPYYLEGRLIFNTSDGGAVAVVSYYLLNAFYNVVIRLDAAGNMLWKKPLGVLSDGVPADFADGCQLPDGSIVLYGYQGTNLFLIKMSPDGLIYPHSLSGSIVRDTTYNCVVDSFDAPLKYWTLQAQGNGMTHYAATDESGHYTFTDLDSGAYQITLAPASYLWLPCEDTVNLQFNDVLPKTDTLDFPIQSLYDCASMHVDIGGSGNFRRCTDEFFTVNYCNAGNDKATSASVTVAFDPLLHIQSASRPYTQNGQTLTFELGTVPAGECGSIQIAVQVDCDATLGQALCATAHVYPDTFCAPNLPGWSGAHVVVSAVCNGDSIQFQVKNAGIVAMPEALGFIIVDDHVITKQGNFQLNSGDVLVESVLADGSTWRLIAEQEPGFPFGMQKPSVGVEGCAGGAGNFTTGMLNMFANFSGNPFEDTYCGAVIGSFDPNDKQALPIGADAQHYIEQNEPIEYLIRFQNTGNDTAFAVVLRDTLSPWLDPTTLRMGAASHPYTWSLGGPGILTVTFDNILLPDSNVNEAASHGFVWFRIQQRRDNPLGTLLENRAGIYFDFNAPVLTNTVFHTVGHNFLPTAEKKPPVPPARIAVQPNPAVGSVWVKMDGDFVKGRRLVLRDITGRFVREVPVAGPKVELRREELFAGLYWLELREGPRLLAIGKVVWVD